MSASVFGKLQNLFVAALMVSSILPVALLAGASATPALLPAPSSPLGTDLGDLNVLPNAGTASQGLSADALAPSLPASSAVDEETLDSTPQDPVGLITDYLVSQGAKPEDVGMPIVDFLEKYPQFKAQVAERTGIRALLADEYHFTDSEKALIQSRIELSSYRSHTEPLYLSHADLLQQEGIRVPMGVVAGARLGVIDDDGSENNGGPGDTNAALEFPFTDQTAQVTAALNASSIDYEIYVRPYGGLAPSFTWVANHDQIIYVAGQNYAGAFGTQMTRRLTAFVEAEGDLWLIGEFMPFTLDGLLFGTDNATNPPIDPFLTGIMGVSSYVSAGSADPMVGTNSGYLNGQSYDLTRNIPSNITGTSGILDYSYSLNYSSTISQGLTSGSSLGWNDDPHTNVMGNLRSKAASQGVVMSSTFEFSYLTVASERDDFVNRMYTNLSATPGFTWDAGSDISPADISITPNIDAWSGNGVQAYDNLGNFLGYYVFYAAFITRWVPATVNVTIDNYRDAAFLADPKIVLEGDGNVISATRAENSSLLANITIPAKSSFNVSMTFTPHRMFNLRVHAVAAVLNSDTVTTNNDLYLSSIGVAGFYEGAEVARTDMVNSGFSIVNNPPGANSGTSYWFTGSGNNINNSLTLPWMDVRCYNSTTATPDMSPCAARSQTLIWDLLYFLFFINGSVTAPDALFVEYRNDTNMVWSSIFSISIETRQGGTGPLTYLYYGSGFAGGQIFAYGVRVPQFAQDQFIQLRLRYTTGGASSSTGYRIDDFGLYTMKEVNNRPDFGPLFTNAIVAPSPSYKVWRGGTMIASGKLTGTIDINETETVTVHSEINDPQTDKFTYTWTQSPAGFTTLPANSTGYVYNGNILSNVTTALNSFETVCNANGYTGNLGACAGGGGNMLYINLTATDELGVANMTSWVIRIKDAVPSYAGPLSFSLDEDTTYCMPATGLNEWFSDPEGDTYTFFATSPDVNGSRTVTLADNRLTNGTVCLTANSVDWHGLTNITISGTDPKGSVATMKVNVTILPVNDAPRFPAGPVAEATRINATPGGVQKQYLSFNVTLFDIDDPQNSLIVTWVSTPGGTWVESRNATGNLQLYVTFPDNAMVGPNSFNITICDPHGACTPLKVTVNIANVNDPPEWISTIDTRYATQGVEFREQMLAFDPDDSAPGEPKTSFLWTDDTSLFDINATGWIIFTPTNDQVGSWPVTVRVSDRTASNPLSFTVVVNNTNDPPVLPPYADINVSQDVPYTAPFLRAQDPDLALWNKLPSGQTETLVYSDDCPLFNIEKIDQASSTPGAPPDPVGRIVIRATNDQVGVWTCTVTVTDLGGLSDTLTIRIFVNNVNDSPSNVRVNITDPAGTVKPITVTDTKVAYDEDQALTFNIFADDPDLRHRLIDPSMQVDPAEKLTCSVFSQFVGSLDVPQATPAKPELDSPDYDVTDGCVVHFTPTNNEVGTFTITFTVRDTSQTSLNFKVKLEVRNVNDAPTNLRVVSPTSGFSIDATGTLSLAATAADVDTPDSLLTFAWTVEVVGGGKFTASGKNAQVQVSNGDAGDKQVRVTLKVTDNADASNPIEVTQAVNGTIKGKPTTPGFELPAVFIGLSLVAALFAASRRRRDE